MKVPLLIVPFMNCFRTVACLALLAGVAGVAAGCGGISGSHSVSPASFFLPGLIHYEAPVPPPSPNPAEEPAPPITGPESKPLTS